MVNDCYYYCLDSPVEKHMYHWSYHHSWFCFINGIIIPWQTYHLQGTSSAWRYPLMKRNLWLAVVRVTPRYTGHETKVWPEGLALTFEL